MPIHDQDFFNFVWIKKSSGISISECIPFLESIVLDKDFCISEQKRLVKEMIEYALGEIYAFHKAMLGWTNEESHEWLMNQGHQDIYVVGGSWFYHEVPLYWAADAIIPEEVDNFMNRRGGIAEKIVDAVLNEKTSCADYSECDWQEARQRINLLFEEKCISYRV